MSYRYDFSVYITVIKYRPQKIVLPACPGDLPACPPKWTKVKGKCAGVPSIYILQPAYPKVAAVQAVQNHHETRVYVKEGWREDEWREGDGDREREEG